MTDEGLNFTIRIDHNPYLAVGRQTVHAIIQVRAAEPGSGAGSAPPVAAEVIIIDKSKSMTGSKIVEACRAASAAVDVLRDGTYFAVIAGQTFAELVYPPEPVMVPASGTTRAAAKREIGRMAAAGTTGMSTWLTLADTLLTSCPAQIKHALMLTDGHSTEDDDALSAALTQCAGHFVCDCRGVGDGWKPSELRKIARTLLGTWAPVAAPQQLADDFRAVLTAAMAKRVTGVLLAIRPTGRTKVSYFAQVMPSIEDLTGKCVVSGDGQTIEFPLGDWGDQVRDYDLRLEADQHDLAVKTGEEARAARLKIVLPPSDDPGGSPRVAASASLGVLWTTDVALSGPINRRVAGYTGQEELATAVDEGLDAWRNGRADAEAKVGRAVRLAHQLQHQDLLERFTAIADLIDPAAGIVRLRRYEQVSRVNEIWASYLSEQSRYIDPDGAAGPDGDHG
jgi:von Willebrand factor type A domain